jgi:hypothetical protein
MYELAHSMQEVQQLLWLCHQPVAIAVGGSLSWILLRRDINPFRPCSWVALGWPQQRGLKPAPVVAGA